MIWRLMLVRHTSVSYTHLMDKIRGYLINPVDTREASMDKPATLKVEYAIPTLSLIHI